MVATTMPAAEVEPTNLTNDEENSYELAFHVLPTVAEGEVPGVFDEIKALITKVGGEITSEEAPERIDLEYEIVKPLEGKNRKFASAYFGWVRFRLQGEKVELLTEGVDSHAAILRYLLIKLTKLEEANPFRIHETRKSDKMVKVVDEDAEVIKETQTEVEEAAEVSEEELDKSLDKITGEEEDEEKKVDENTEVVEDKKEETK